MRLPASCDWLQKGWRGLDCDYTLVVTSANRFDLLEQTLTSFFQYAIIEPRETIIVDDSAQPMPSFLATDAWNNRNLNWLTNGRQKGQLYSIDRAYELVNTELLFHAEDDWLFYRAGFIEASVPILEEFPRIIQVWLREQNDTNGHPIERMSDHDFDLLALDYLGKYHGFSLNPTLRRRSDWKSIGSYGMHWPYKPEGALRGEEEISRLYRHLGYRAAILREGYVRHIGKGRHVGKTMNEACAER
jgi:hypothetical protein